MTNGRLNGSAKWVALALTIIATALGILVMVGWAPWDMTTKVAAKEAHAAVLAKCNDNLKAHMDRSDDKHKAMMAAGVARQLAQQQQDVIARDERKEMRQVLRQILREVR